jgi:hypothetical protein
MKNNIDKDDLKNQKTLYNKTNTKLGCAKRAAKNAIKLYNEIRLKTNLV